MSANGIILEVLIFQIIIVIALLVLVIILAKIAKSIKVERRISRYALVSLNNEEESFFDILYKGVENFIHITAEVIGKSHFVRRYGNKFEKYIVYEERNSKTGIDYIAIKFLLGLLLIIFNMTVTFLQYQKIVVMTALISFLIGFFIIDVILSIRYRHKRKEIEEDLLKAIIIMNNAFKSGRNVIQAVEDVGKELEGPISDEFKKIHLDIKYGLSLEVVFSRFYSRVKIADAKYISSSLALLNRTGGNIIKVFNAIEKTIYSKRKMRAELKALTASSVFVFRMLICLPIIFIGIITILNPTYFTPFFTSPIGIIALVIILILYLVYILIVKKLLKVEI